MQNYNEAMAMIDKLLEEANEVINANKKEETEEELADLLEVVRAIANFKNIDVSDIIGHGICELNLTK